jgi:hypothetical protein
MFVKQQRLPIDPLLRFCKAYKQSELAKTIGVHSDTVANWIKYGGVPEMWADEAAIKLGVHPSAIWGDAWFDLAKPKSDDTD